VAGAGESMGDIAGEGTGDDAAHTPRTLAQLSGGRAHRVQVRERHARLVGGELEDAIGRGVEDWPTGPQMDGAQALDDFGAAGGNIPERAAADVALEFAHER